MNADDIALSFERGVSYATAIHLLEVFGSASAVYAAGVDALVGQAELNPALARNIFQKNEHRRAEEELRFIEKHGITPIASTDPLYPALLRECNDYPHVLYYKGDPAALNASMVSMVGTRRVNTYGLSVCNRLVGDLARAMPELVIVSGLAFGVDIACHRAALAHGLRTIGVMANNATEIYPSVHKQVAEDMVRRGGGILTELSSQDKAGKARFLQRNRIIAGMSPGTIVVQSPPIGGSMITANHVDGYNRVLMAPPANIGEELSEGTNLLIRKLKARMICSAADILEELGWQTDADLQPAQARPLPPEGPERAVYACIRERGRPHLEEIGAATGIAAQELLGVLLELEFAGFVRVLPGNRYEKF